MTTEADIVNRGLQAIGTRTTVTTAELAANSTNEAIQANLVLANIRDDLMRMAPWNCSVATANMVLISAVPGTPENTSPAATLWQPGLPPPPWAYEYQYPNDCIRACWVTPATQTGFAGGVPITTAVTGGAPSFWQGGPVKFKVQTDKFRPVTNVVVASAGTGHAVDDVITLPPGLNTNAPIGAPAQILVTSVGGAGDITGATVISQVMDASPALGGSYFQPQVNPVVQYTTTGSGIGATFNLFYGPAAPQRVILTNQEFAILNYCRRVTDPNIMDTLFQSAWSSVLGSTLCMALSGDLKKANGLITQANDIIVKARAQDGNEGLTSADYTPDWIRVRGVLYSEGASGPYNNFDWGGLWPSYA